VAIFERSENYRHIYRDILWLILCYSNTMNKTLFFIQTLIIIVLLVICTTIAIQLREYQKAYGLRSNKPVVGMNVSPEATTSASPYPTLAEDQVPDFSKVTNSASNPPEVEAVLGHSSPRLWASCQLRAAAMRRAVDRVSQSQR
jgi:hypothetical protein